MSNQIVIEANFGGTCKKLQRVPGTIEDLLSQLEDLFKIKNLKLQYLDDEGDLITISTTRELQESIEVFSLSRPPLFKILIDKGPNFQSLEDSDIEIDDATVNTVRNIVRNEMEKELGIDRTRLPVWENVRCDGCDEFPIAGLRFKCTVCDNFDFCEICEMGQEHPHPFVKLTTKDHNIQMIKVSLDKPGKNLIKATLKKHKMKFIQHVNYMEGEKVSPGQVMEKVWRVKNIGNEDWPAGCKAGALKGDLPGTGYEFGPLASGETVDVLASIEIPYTEGRYTGVWRLFTPDGTSFGDKLYIVVQSLFDEHDINQSLLEKLLSLSIDRQKAITALRHSQNDFESAISFLFHS